MILMNSRGILNDLDHSAAQGFSPDYMASRSQKSKCLKKTKCSMYFCLSFPQIVSPVEGFSPNMRRIHNPIHTNKNTILHFVILNSLRTEIMFNVRRDTNWLWVEIAFVLCRFKLGPKCIQDLKISTGGFQKYP